MSESLECKVCDTNIAEPTPPKVIVVVETAAGDRPPIERRYLAHEADDHRDYGFLRIRRDGLPVAGYAQGAWLSFREDGASTGDPFFRQGKKLAIALDALKRLASDKWVMPEDVGGDQGDELTARRDLADQALYDIADVDL